MHGAATHSSLARSRTALTQSILLLEKFYGLIFIRLSETTTEEMMCARVLCCVSPNPNNSMSCVLAAAASSSVVSQPERITKQNRSE